MIKEIYNRLGREEDNANNDMLLLSNFMFILLIRACFDCTPMLVK